MDKIPEVVRIEDMPEEYDDRGLDLILNGYNQENTPKCQLSIFRSKYLPLLAKKHPRIEDDNAVRLQWVTEVAGTYRSFVFIINEHDEVVYRVPPLLGSVNTSITAHEESMAMLNKKEAELRGRLQSQANALRARKLALPIAQDHMTRQYQRDWFTIMLNEGYERELKETIGDGPYPDYIAEVVGNKLDHIDLDKPATPAKPSGLRTQRPVQTIGVIDEEDEYLDDDED